MAGTEYGKDWRVCIGDGASPEVFTPIGGETSFDWTRTSDKIDLSSKDDGIYKSNGFGQQEVAFSISGNVKLPDVALQDVLTASKASPPQISIQIKKGSVVKYHGTVGVGNFKSSHPNGGAVSYSFDATNIGTPTVDDLGADA